MLQKRKKIRRAIIIYWVLLAYIIAALVWWFIALSRQNAQMSRYKIQALHDDHYYLQRYDRIKKAEKRKTAQYLGEGGTFLLLIIAGAIFVFRAVRRELRTGAEQQHFMMAVTHELKTPIAIAKLNLETMQKHRLDEIRQQRLLQNTLEETNRLDTLCNNLLLSARMDSGSYGLTDDEQDLSVLVSDCVRDFINRYPQRTIKTEIAENVFVKGDPFLLQMAVNNLLDNAVKYSPKESPVELSLEKYAPMATLRIVDEGPGIPPEERKKIFQKFYRMGNEATKRAKGTGLGLYLTQRIAKAHDGNITMQNNPAGGSIFVLSLRAEA